MGESALEEETRGTLNIMIFLKICHRERDGIGK
jgi:hypothetical protein